MLATVCREYRLKEKFGSTNITKRDVLSAAMYPKVFEEVSEARKAGERGQAQEDP
jgi:pyruvate carboxylase